MRRKKAKLTDIRAGRVGKWGDVKLRSQLAVGALTFMLAFGVDVAPVYALSAADVVDKTTGVQIETAADATNITAPDKAIINWNKFNIASGETVNFIQPNVSAMVLNRVQAGGGVSEILGMLNANGNVFLINPNGVLFGAGSQVNAAGLVVSTANITDENFKNGKLIFEQDNKTNANIIINGTLNAETNGEYVKSVLNVEALPKVTGITSINNIIKIVADGDIIVGGTGSLQAVTTTQVEGDGTVGQESFAVEGADSIAEGKIILRADANADDLADYHQSLYEENVYKGGTLTRYNSATGLKDGNGTLKAAKVYLNNDKDSQVASKYVSVYYNPDFVGGINQAATADLGAAAGSYTKKNYANYSNEAAAYKSKIAGSFNAKTNVNGTNDDGGNKTTNGINQEKNIHMLVNDVYQLQSIDNTKGGNLGGGYALGTTIAAAGTAGWNGSAGFKPIGAGSEFSGSFTGNGGSNTYGIYDLTINRASEDNIGLFSKVTGSIWSTALIDSNIIGKDNVGGLAGVLDKGTIASSTVRKRNAANAELTGKSADEIKTIAAAVNVKGASNVGGLAGEVKVGKIYWHSSNQSRVEGGSNVGGLAGSAADATILDSRNQGTTLDGVNGVSGTGISGGNVTGSGNNVGGLVGTMSNSSISVERVPAATYNSGQVTGADNVGGLAGTMSSGSIKQAYNTNESSALGTVITSAGQIGEKSEYGKVTGSGNNVGGIVGKAENSATLDTVYNAGNVAGKDNVGGVAGSMTGGSITHAYNGDNNTVLKTSTSNDNYYGFTCVDASDNKNYEYIYETATQTFKRREVGSSGAFSEISYNDLQTKVLEKDRLYNNRLAYRDGTVKGVNNVGGIAGTLGSGVTIEQTYNVGKIEGTSNAGALVGVNNGTINNSYYVTTDKGVNNNLSGVDAAVGSGNSGGTAKTLYELQQNGTTGWTDANGEVLVSDNNQNADWIVYSGQSTPLLKAFMSWININREYKYDGTTHNLVTHDVNNYYGGAFFSEGKGQNVTTEDISAITLAEYNSIYKKNLTQAQFDELYANSSKYSYDNSAMWSPQHGYYTDPTATLIITPAELTVKATGEKTYGDNAVAGTAAENTAGKYAVEYSGFVNGEDTGVLSGNLDALQYKDDKQQLNAGAYKLQADNLSGNTLTANNNNYKIKYAGTLTVNKAKLQVKAAGGRTYGDDNKFGDFTFTAEANRLATDDTNQNNGQLKSWDKDEAADLTELEGFKQNGGDGIVLSTADGGTGTGTAITAQTNVKGTGATPDKYVLDTDTSFKKDGKSQLISSNYEIEVVKGDYQINRAGLQYDITGSQTYGTTADKTYEFTPDASNGLKAGDTIDQVVSQTGLTAAADSIYSADGLDSSTHVGRDAAGNVIAVVNHELQDNEVGVALSGTAKGNNYTLKPKRYKFTVNPAELKYTVADNSKVYGDTTLQAQATGQLSGFVNSENAANAYNNTENKGNITTATITEKDGILAGTAAVKRDANGNVVAYEDALQGGGLYYNDYNVVYEHGAVTITPKGLTAKADNTSKTYGDFNPVFTTQWEGFVNGDSMSVGAGTLNYSTAAGQYSDAGEYDVTPEGLSFNNYDVSYQSGTLTVNKAALSYTADDKNKTYGTVNPEFTGTWTGFVNGQDVSSAAHTGSLNLTTNAGQYSDVTADGYAITAGGMDFKNYNVTYNKGTLTIKPKDITYDVTGSWTYGGTNASYTGAINGIASVDIGQVYTGDVAAETAEGYGIVHNSDAGKYTYVTNKDNSGVTLNGAKSGNYSLVNGTFDFTVNKAKLIYTVDNANKIYGEQDPAFASAAGFQGFVNGEQLDSLVAGGKSSGSISYLVNGSVGPNGQATAAGGHAITASGQLFTNYDVDYIDGTLTVTPADLYFTAQGEINYGAGTAPSGTLKDHFVYSPLHVNTAGDDDAANNGALKSWDGGNADNLAELAGFMQNGSDGLVIRYQDENGSIQTVTSFADLPEYAQNGVTRVEYALADGSFMRLPSSDSGYNGSNQLQSQNYNWIFVPPTMNNPFGGGTPASVVVMVRTSVPDMVYSPTYHGVINPSTALYGNSRYDVDYIGGGHREIEQRGSVRYLSILNTGLNFAHLFDAGMPNLSGSAANTSDDEASDQQ